MLVALDEAQKGQASGEVPVGAVIVAPTGEIISRACNRVEEKNDPTAHAEILAIREAASIIGNCRLKDCLLVATLEPCLMCAGALIQSRVPGLVFGAADALAGAIISSVHYFDLPGARSDFWHLGGILSHNCADLLQKFFQDKR